MCVWLFLYINTSHSLSLSLSLMNKFPDGQPTIYADDSASAGTKDGGAGAIRRSPRRLRKKYLRNRKNRFFLIYFIALNSTLDVCYAHGSSNG